MTRTAISPRLATRTFANIRPRDAIRPPHPRPPRPVHLERRGPPPGAGRPAPVRVGPRGGARARPAAAGVRPGHDERSAPRAGDGGGAGPPGRPALAGV